jgi:hypothetical protein
MWHVLKLSKRKCKCKCILTKAELHTTWPTSIYMYMYICILIKGLVPNTHVVTSSFISFLNMRFFGCWVWGDLQLFSFRYCFCWAFEYLSCVHVFSFAPSHTFFLLLIMLVAWISHPSLGHPLDLLPLTCNFRSLLDILFTYLYF